MKKSIALLAVVGAIAHPAVFGAVTFTNNTSVTDATYDGQDLVVSDCTVIVAGVHTFGSLQVLDGGIITVPRAGTNLNLTFTKDALVASGGRFTVDGLALPGGPGAGTTSGSPLAGSGGSFGGEGGQSATGARAGTVYGSVADAILAGSAGGAGLTGPGGAGGGSMSLTVRGELRVDGEISANGANGFVSRAGGGSGGGIWISAVKLSGSGSISADGGDGEPGAGGGGGGGRIAVNFTENLFSGTLSAVGGKGHRWGGAGSIYTKAAGATPARVLLDNGGHSGVTTLFSIPGNLELVIQGGAMVVPKTSLALDNLTVGPDGWLFMSNQAYSVTVFGSALIESGGEITADGVSSAGIGDGRTGILPSSNVVLGGGGGHGGFGGSGIAGITAYGGNAFDSTMNPTSAGGRGGGGTTGAGLSGGLGGGVVKLTINGMLVCNGRVSADGGDGKGNYAGGGAGGSVVLNVGMLAGSGVISANGGKGSSYGAYAGGGGGGGRISIQTGADFFFGTIVAQGGSGMSAGGAGTIIKRPSSTGYAEVLVDNGGKQGTNTLLGGVSGFDLTVSGGAVVNAPVEMVNNLLVASNSLIAFPSSSTSQQGLRISKNAVIEAGGGITADGMGFLGGTIGGVGGSVYVGDVRIGGGGGYGGYGGAGVVTGSTQNAAGGAAYGSVTRPLERGSAGGGSDNRVSGSVGGGAVYLIVTGELLLSGRISANGGNASVSGAGGGSGGSVLLEVGSFAGSGQVTANGGSGAGPGGGGGGGRIAVTYTIASTFNGTITASGGDGGNIGGAGTIYVKPNTGVPRLIVDNGGQIGANTLLSAITTGFDLELGGGASIWPAGSTLLVSNLLLHPGGTLTFSQVQSNATIVVNGIAIIESTAAISVNGKGFAAGTGPGAGLSTNQVGSGAGYGGSGGSSSLAVGGSAYGFLAEPVEKGSGGGRGYYTALASGSEGGGALRMIVRRALLLDGVISANGNDAVSESAGGGSGGSVWIDAGSLFGNGSIQAIGGAGEFLHGGGGAGGRVAIYTRTNAFVGAISVAGGEGFQSGETGSVFIGTAPIPLSVVSQMPTGILQQAISSVSLQMNTIVDRATLSPGDFLLNDPDGNQVPVTLTVTNAGPSTVRASFAPQTKEGVYSVRFGPQVLNLHGAGMTNAYTGAFRIVWPSITGHVLATNGQALAGVVLHADPTMNVATTDEQGFYTLKVPPGTVIVTPVKVGFIFSPATREYTLLSADLQGQDYTAVPAALALASAVQTGSLVLSWQGIPGAEYQLLTSTNLADWSPLGDGMSSTNINTLMQLKLSIESGGAARFFRLKAIR